ncbi:DivIVA domain-containing protein [Nocardioides sp. G10]|uniref:DivIVA domain-containing protein n=2 Tax=Nocardioides baculatus TaxID=2801337 RepID=A0ABS1LC44_9ACTN|nr:DivIVA domain-containing protein [Nocardioides baculatus]
MASFESDGTPGITPAEIEQLRFTPVRLGAGYDMGEVDAWLDTVTAELDRRGSGAARTTTPSPPMAEPKPTAGAPAPSSPAAVQEVGGRIDLKVTALAMIGVVALVLVLAYVL